MKKTGLQIFLLILFASLCLFVILQVRHFLDLPFRSANDGLHRIKSPLTLDFLIPAGTHLDEKITIGEVLSIRIKKQAPLYQEVLRSLLKLISPQYRYLADLILFLFWSFLYLTFFRIFTIMGYGRAIRASLLFGGCTYYFMPDLSVGLVDDLVFVCIPVFIIVLGIYLRRNKRKRMKALKA